MSIADLPRWQAKLATPTLAAAASLAVVGDSTSDGSLFPGIYTHLRGYLTSIGQGLHGMTPDADHIIDGGTGGEQALNWISGDGGSRYTYTQLKADAPDLCILSLGINDAIALKTQNQITGYLTTIVNQMRSDLPLMDIVLRMPGFFLTTGDTLWGGTGWGVGNAQVFTDLLRNAYLALEGIWDNVVVAKVQPHVFATTAPASSSLMGDAVHPSDPLGYNAIFDYIVREYIGRFRPLVA